jgi:hypothetical protein
VEAQHIERDGEWLALEHESDDATVVSDLGGIGVSCRDERRVLESGDGFGNQD